MLLLLVAGAVGGGWWIRRRLQAPIVPLPSEIRDPRVRQKVESERQKVFDRPQDADAWGHLGLVYLANLFDREADRCFDEAARLDRSDPRWPYGRALMALKRAPDEALPLLRQAVAAAENRPDYRSPLRLRLAETLLERDEVDEAEKLFRAEWQPRQTARAAFGLGLVALRRGDNDAARSFFLVARASPYARKKATAQLAVLARRQHDSEAAARYEKEAAGLSDDPAWPDPVLDRVFDMRMGIATVERKATRLENERRFAEAADLWLEELATNPSPNAYMGAGLNLVRTGDYERALPLLQEAIRIDPANPRTHYTLALSLFDRAEKTWVASPDSPEARGWFTEAIRHAQRATELKPDYGAAYLCWGVCLKYLGRPVDALPPLRKGVLSHPEDFELQLALGQVLLALGQKQEAATHLNNARRLDPEDPRPAESLQQLGAKKP